MMVDLITMQECCKALKNIKDLWARLKLVLIQVEFVRAFRLNFIVMNKIE